MTPLSTPVAFFIFNRPETTEAVFREIAAARPQKLLIVADGPRPDRSDDVERCESVRRIVEDVPWDCEVLRNYSDVNLGCKARVSSGLDWVFKECEEAIILEDDCLPDPTFFTYCSELLRRYRDDERVMTISGTNFLDGTKRTDFTYYFSRIPFIWGWASWRRAWQHYDVSMTEWPTLRNSRWLESIFPWQEAVSYWTRKFDATYDGSIDTWDYQWIMSSWLQSGITCAPKVNLIENIGFGEDATHAMGSPDRFRMPRKHLCEMEHPFGLMWQWQADRDYFQRALGLRIGSEATSSAQGGFTSRAQSFVRKTIRGIRRRMRIPSGASGNTHESL